MPLHYLSYPERGPPEVVPAVRAGAGQQPHVLYFFIPGNPGLIDYYEPHLAHLRTLVDKWSFSSSSSSSSSPAIHIYGQDQDGFNTESCSTDDQGIHGPFNVEHQISVVVSRIRELLNPNQNPLGQDLLLRPFTHLILSGHSMGAFMALQIAQRQHRDPTFLLHPASSSSSSSSPSPSPSPPSSPPSLNSTFLLFPTISHIAASPNGRVLSRIRSIPFLERYIAPTFLNSILPYLLPSDTTLAYLASKLASLPPRAADIFATWIRSGGGGGGGGVRGPSGLWQTLSMAFDELDVIADKPWDEDLWGDDDDDDDDDSESSSSSSLPKFCFYYGSKDPWVSTTHRDSFIKARLDGQEKGRRVRVQIDDGDVPHAFCIEKRHSELVARKVDGFLREIYGVPEQ